MTRLIGGISSEHLAAGGASKPDPPARSGPYPRLAHWRSLILQNSEYRRTADPEFLGNRLRLHPLPSQLNYFGSLALSRGCTTLVLALGLGFGNAFALALQHDLPLKLGKRPHEVQHELAGGCGRIEV